MTNDERELLLALASRALFGNTRPYETEISKLMQRIKYVGQVRERADDLANYIIDKAKD